MRMTTRTSAFQQERPPHDHVESVEGVDVRLGSWVGSRRQDFKNGKLSLERVAVFEAFPGWE
jgi:hypothetical protein